MGNVLFNIIALIFIFLILKYTGIKRLCVFITGVIFFPYTIVIIQQPLLLDFHKILVFSLLLSEIARPKEFNIDLYKFPLLKALSFVFLAMFIVSFFDQNLSIILKFYRPTYYFIESFVIIFLAYRSINDKNDLEYFLRFLLIIVLILAFYGFYNLLTRTNPYYSFISLIYNVPSFFDDYLGTEDRFRVNSFVFHPITFGYYMAIFGLMYFYSFFNIQKLRQYSSYIFPLIIFCILLSNSRTPLSVFILGLLIYILFGVKLKYKFIISFVILLLVILVISFNSSRFQIIFDTADIAKTGGEQSKGSNLNMRLSQFDASYAEFIKSPILGNGYGFLSDNKIQNENFLGLESYIYVLMIEQGLLGILANIIFFLSLFFFYVFNYKHDRQLCVLGISQIVMFLIFILGTGTMHTWSLALTIQGILIKIIEIKRNEHKKITRNCYTCI